MKIRNYIVGIVHQRLKQHISTTKKRKMKNYKVVKWKRTGMSSFESSESIMTEDMLRMNFPTWKGDTVHHVGRHIYHIEEIKE
jgi:hypothetical protein